MLDVHKLELKCTLSHGEYKNVQIYTKVQNIKQKLISHKEMTHTQKREC